MSFARFQRGAPTAGRYVSVATLAFLPRCANCHTPHPHARTPPLYQDDCPDCGTPSVTGETVEVAAKSGLWLFLANIFQGIASWLIKLSERI